MANIQGIVTSSLSVIMQDVTMSFFTASDSTITYTTYTDVNGIYTQSVTDDWSGSLRPTGSGYEFFISFNNSASFTFVTSSSDRTQDWIGVRNFNSGSGTFSDPYCIGDAIDMHNVRFRTGSNTFPDTTHYQITSSEIDLSIFPNWLPIPARQNHIFRGRLNGNNSTIKNMIITGSQHGDSTEYLGLFSYIYVPTSGNLSTIENLNFYTCSIILDNCIQGGSANRYLSFLTGREFNSTDTFFRNIHINSCSVEVKYGNTSNGAIIYFGSIFALGDGNLIQTVESCSVENSNFIFSGSQTLGGNVTVNMGGIVCNPDYSDFRMKHCSSKNNNFYIRKKNNTNPTVGGLNAQGGILTENYVLSCSFDIQGTSTLKIGPIGYQYPTGGSKNYVALISYIMIPSASRTFSGLDTDFAGNCYYESGTNVFLPETAGVGVTGSTMEQMKNWINYNTYNFVGVWDINQITSKSEHFAYTASSIATSDYVSASFLGYNYRNIITGSTIIENAPYAKVVLKSNPTQDWTFTNVSIMKRIPGTVSASSYATLYFSGNAGATVTTGQDLESDAVVFDLVAGEDYFVHIVKPVTSYPIPFVSTPWVTGSIHRAASTNYSETLNYTTSLLYATGSYGILKIIGVNIITGSNIPEKNYEYPYFMYEEFPAPPIATAGLTLHYDSRIGYVSASNIWTDLSGQGTDASTVNTFPTGGNLYFGTEFGGNASASITELLISESFAIEIWTAPTTQSGQLTLFTTVSGTFPRIDSYIISNSIYLGYQGTGSIPIEYISSSNIIIPNRFNHIAFYISGTTGQLWANGTFFGSASITTGSWTAGTIGIVDTEQTNPYFGYISVFKVWNGMPINVAETTKYHADRNYISVIPDINYPI